MKKRNIVTKLVTCFDEILEVTNQRVVYWRKEDALILSDLHIGKSAHFQRSGIPIPSSILAVDLLRLEELIHHFKPEQLIVVGDLFHARYNKDLDTFKVWLSSFKNLSIKLVKGNHDRLQNRIYEAFEIEVFSEFLQIDSLKFVHDFSVIQPDVFTISGHTHPGVLLKGKGKQRVKLPCYQITKYQLILPAFSLFTGLNVKDAPSGCKNFGFTESAIFEL